MNRVEHLLTIAGEECNEVAQRTTKALRFGLSEAQPGQPFDNAERILMEYADLLAVVEMLQSEGHLPVWEASRMRALMDAKKRKVEKYLAYARDIGTLEVEHVQ
jgi:hypothetical protein